MRIGATIGGGLAGGLIGAALWACFSYFTNYEIGWIAWGVGVLVGIGVRLGGQDWQGAGPGSAAVVIAILAIAGGKYAAASMVSPLPINDKPPAEVIKVQIAREIVKEKQLARVPINWTMPAATQEQVDFMMTHGLIPSEIKQEADKRWNELGEQVQNEMIAEERQSRRELNQLFSELNRQQVFSNLGAFDFLFVGLASLTAYKIGSGINDAKS